MPLFYGLKLPPTETKGKPLRMYMTKNTQPVVNIEKIVDYSVPLYTFRWQPIQLLKQSYQRLTAAIVQLLRGVIGQFERFIAEEYSIVRIILLSTSLVCFLFGYFGTSLYYYRQINLLQSLVGLSAFCISHTTFGKQHIRVIGYVFIYFLDISNATLIATSGYDDKLSYQYIIYFFVTSLFFDNKRTLLGCIAINFLYIMAIARVPAIHSSSVSDFYLSFFGSAFALVLLMLRKFDIDAKLAEKELKYRLLAENSADIICTHKVNGEFEFVSPSIALLTGYSSAEMQGKTPTYFIYPEDRRQYTLKMSGKDSSVLNEAFHYRFKTKNGSYIWLETVVKEMEEGKGRYLSQTRSFQRHKQYLEQIERNTTELQSSYKDLEMFAYISSHDMQEPLRMISNYMQLLKRKYKAQLDQDAMDYIDFAVKGASNLQALIKDLLSYSTINKKEITKSSINMDELIDDILSSLQILTQERNAKVYINEPLLPVMGDKNALTQLVQNLIQNGIKYNTSDAPVIRVFCTEDAKQVTYCIQDNGIGIDKQYSKQIFEPFQRLHNKHNFQGTGLGLSICRKIIDRLGGKIWVESELGVGSSFFFSIPKQ